MPNTFKRKLAEVSNAEAEVYATPVGATTVVIGFMISNKTPSLIKVTITAAGKVLGKDLPIPGGSALSVLDGKLVLEATDTVTVESNVADSADTILSIMEIT